MPVFFLSATLPHFVHTNLGFLTISLNLSSFMVISSFFHLQSSFVFFAIFFSFIAIVLPGELNLTLSCLLFTLNTKNMVVNAKSRYFFSLEENELPRRPGSGIPASLRQATGYPPEYY